MREWEQGTAQSANDNELERMLIIGHLTSSFCCLILVVGCMQ